MDRRSQLGRQFSTQQRRMDWTAEEELRQQVQAFPHCLEERCILVVIFDRPFECAS